MNAYYNNSDIRKISTPKLEDKLTRIICALISVITNATFVKIIKIAIMSAALFGFVFILGMIDRGEISFFGGVAVCSLLCGVEIITAKTISVHKD